MNTIKDNYYEEIKYNPIEHKKTPYYVFIVLFIKFIKDIDSNLPTELITISLINTQDELKNLLSDENKILNKEIIDEYVSLENKSKNKLSNVDNAVVLYYMDSSKYLSSYPEWNSDNLNDYTNSPTKQAKDMAHASNVLLNINKSNMDKIDFDSNKNLKFLGTIAEERMDTEEAAKQLFNLKKYESKNSSKSSKNSNNLMNIDE